MRERQVYNCTSEAEGEISATRRLLDVNPVKGFNFARCLVRRQVPVTQLSNDTALSVYALY